MKILLVRPDAPKASINLQSFMICEPLELEYAASALTQAGHEVDLVDMLLEKKPLSAFLKKKEYQMVCFTAYITCVGVVKRYAGLVKKHNKNILTAVGGVHAEVVPTDFVDTNVDYILFGNGIHTLVGIADAYPRDAREELPGIYAEVTRPAKIKVEYYNEKFEKVVEEFDRFACRMVQHELSHLEGNLFVDNVSPIRRKMIARKLQAISKGSVQTRYKSKR